MFKMLAGSWLLNKLCIDWTGLFQWPSFNLLHLFRVAEIKLFQAVEPISKQIICHLKSNVFLTVTPFQVQISQHIITGSDCELPIVPLCLWSIYAFIFHPPLLTLGVLSPVRLRLQTNMFSMCDVCYRPVDPLTSWRYLVNDELMDNMQLNLLTFTIY